MNEAEEINYYRNLVDLNYGISTILSRSSTVGPKKSLEEKKHDIAQNFMTITWYLEHDILFNICGDEAYRYDKELKDSAEYNILNNIENLERICKIIKRSYQDDTF